jgi:N-methylhydantoinase A/oxoprolinase/acetone carboxylase beta subunit
MAVAFSREESGKIILRKALSRNDETRNQQISFSVELQNPMVAVGAPVEAYFPELSNRLQAKLYLPEYAEVANAIGTVSGKAVERATVLVKPGEGGGFIVHTPTRREFFMIFDEAVDYACSEGQRYVQEQAAEGGAVNIKTIVERQDHYSALVGATGDNNDSQRIFIESVIEISAVGRPWS